MAEDLSKINRQMEKAGLPTGGTVPFCPQLDKNKAGEPIIKKAPVEHGPKKGKFGMWTPRGESGSKTERTATIPTIGTCKRMGEKRGEPGSMSMVIFCYDAGSKSSE